MRAGEKQSEADVSPMLLQGDVLGRIFRPLFGLIRESWHMYPLGFLFGLGFDTATEVALLGISASEVSRGLPIVSVLVFPALFTAGMVLVDRTETAPSVNRMAARRAYGLLNSRKTGLRVRR